MITRSQSYWRSRIPETEQAYVRYISPGSRGQEDGAIRNSSMYRVRRKAKASSDRSRALAMVSSAAVRYFFYEGEGLIHAEEICRCGGVVPSVGRVGNPVYTGQHDQG
jgi:hypothetical protein